MMARPALARLAFVLMAPVVVLGIGEVFARWRVPPSPARALERHPGAGPLEQTLVWRDSCSGRLLTMTVNAAGGRGVWPTAARPGVRRVLALGDSSTFGVTSSDATTWPALLEREWRRRGTSVEVLNGGRGGVQLDQIVETAAGWLQTYHPALVLYYGGYNYANSVTVDAMTPFGRVTRWLHGHSRLYSMTAEKLLFTFGDLYGDDRLDVEGHRRRLIALVGLIRGHGASPALILQATTHTPGGAGLAARARRARELRAARFRDVALDVARDLGVRVVDPQPALVAGGPGKIWCDEVHLSDTGNGILARAIADALTP